MPPRVALYARYSTDRQRVASIEDQFRICRAYAEREGWTVVQAFSDHAASGSNIDRPGYQAMLAWIRAGKTDIVLAESLERFARNQEHTAGLYNRTEFAGVRIVTIADGAVGDIQVSFGGFVGAQSIKNVRAKTRRGLAGIVLQGRCIGLPPYGYEVLRRIGADGEPERGLRRIVPDQAAIVRRIFRD
jgi:DNA invertase Pin-like site-specific DNA recombinase